MSGGEIAKFVAAALGDKVVLEVSEENDALRDENGALCDENHRLLELLKGLLTVKLINATTGVCYSEGELEHDDYYDAFSTTCQACCHRPRVSLSIFLESPLHLVISGRFFGTLEGSRAVRAGLARWPSEGLAFCIASREGSKFRNFSPGWSEGMERIPIVRITLILQATTLNVVIGGKWTNPLPIFYLFAVTKK